MVEWFSSARADSIDGLISGRRYAKAIDLIRSELIKFRYDPRLRQKLGTALVLSGKRDEGLFTLGRLADDLAVTGQAGQAIVVLKKMQEFDPGRLDVEDKLAHLIKERWRAARQGEAKRWPLSPMAAPGHTGRAAEVPAVREEESMAPPGAQAGESSPPPPGTPAASADAVASPGEEMTEEALRDELISVIEQTLTPSPAPAPTAPPAAATDGEEPLETPLFKGFGKAELAELIRGLRLLRYEPGQIVVSEGEVGASLFLITTGRVRAYVKTAAHRQVQVRELGEGDFFGEISVLTGHPRSATVTAARPCEMLELDKPTLDRICETHPHVRGVMQEFYDQRADNTLETLIRGMGISGV